MLFHWSRQGKGRGKHMEQRMGGEEGRRDEEKDREEEEWGEEGGVWREVTVVDVAELSV